MRKFLKWTVVVSVDPSWVADGFDLTSQRAKAMLAKTLPFANNTEIGAKVVQRPDRNKVAKLMGYKSHADRRRRERT